MKPTLALICLLTCLSSFAPTTVNATAFLAPQARSVDGKPVGPVIDAHIPRGYQTTPAELAVVASKAAKGTEPYRSAVADVLTWAAQPWNYPLDSQTTCPDSDSPAWNDNDEGTPKLYAKALAYHLTGDAAYAQQASAILERIMSEVRTISIDDQQCRLNFSWGTPEMVASADLLEGYWQDKTCQGPASTVYGQNDLTSGACKVLFQNWLVKNPYYVVSYSAEHSQSNWGAAATNTSEYIADYLWDRPEVRLIARTSYGDMRLSPHQAYLRARRIVLNRMNGYNVDLESSSACDLMIGKSQLRSAPPVKSQITPDGIVPDDARRQEFCNIAQYDGSYQNYPQVHLGNNIQQCELLLRRGDTSCFDNVSMQAVNNFPFRDDTGMLHTFNLLPGRGSLERAIQAIIIDSHTEWRHDSALEVAYRYYVVHHRLPGVETWFSQLQRPASCSQDLCFGTLTHAFAVGETPSNPPTVLPPQ